MQTAPVEVIRLPERLLSDDKRVIPRYLDFKSPRRIRSILRRIQRLPEERLSGLLAEVRSTSSHRHRDLEAAFLENFERVSSHLGRRGSWCNWAIAAPRLRPRGAGFS